MNQITTYIVRSGQAFRVVMDGDTGAPLSVSTKSSHGFETHLDLNRSRAKGVAKSAWLQVKARKAAFERRAALSAKEGE